MGIDTVVWRWMSGQGSCGCARLSCYYKWRYQSAGDRAALAGRSGVDGDSNRGAMGQSGGADGGVSPGNILVNIGRRAVFTRREGLWFGTPFIGEDGWTRSGRLGRRCRRRFVRMARWIWSRWLGSWSTTWRSAWTRCSSLAPAAKDRSCPRLSGLS